jgi:NADH-quinone oxidoreductase subunit M
MVLTWIILIPAIGGILAWILARWSASAARWISLLAMAVTFVIAISLWIQHPVTAFGQVIAEQRVPWVPQFGISYHLSMDGLSLLLVLLTTLLGTISVAASWKEITDRVGAFHFSMLLLLAGILGVFLALDLFLFYFFWELMLVPMYFLIGLWGHEDRIRAAIKFFLFTFISGLFMLIAIIGLVIVHRSATGVYTFDYSTLLGTAMPARTAFWLMMGFFTAFAVKLPAFLVHTWLPDAHTEAPTAGSVILAGLMLKTGAYGMLRFAIPLFPAASTTLVPAAMIIGVAGIIYGAIIAFAQRDFKRMVAYTSVSHMGFVLLGIYAGTRIALQGAIVEILAHGLATGALFLIVGMVQERTHTRDFQRLGGLWETMPKLGGFTLFFALAALGLPGMGNFVGEFLVLLGTFQVSVPLAVVGTLGFVFSVVYALRLVQLSVLGPNENNWRLPNLSAREVAILGILAALILWLGLCPQRVLNTASPFTNHKSLITEVGK